MFKKYIYLNERRKVAIVKCSDAILLFFFSPFCSSQFSLHSLLLLLLKHHKIQRLFYMFCDAPSTLLAYFDMFFFLLFLFRYMRTINEKCLPNEWKIKHGNIAQGLWILRKFIWISKIKQDKTKYILSVILHSQVDLYEQCAYYYYICTQYRKLHGCAMCVLISRILLFCLSFAEVKVIFLNCLGV